MDAEIEIEVSRVVTKARKYQPDFVGPLPQADQPPAIEQNSPPPLDPDYWDSVLEEVRQAAAAVDPTERDSAERARAKALGAARDEGPAKADPIDIHTMQRRFVYLIATNEVCDLDHPRRAMNFEHFKNFTASSRMQVQKADGTGMKWIPTADEWRGSANRQDIYTRTWHPGAGQYTVDPHGRSAVNIWTPRPKDDLPPDWQQRAELFVQHVQYLFPIAAEREQFLDWFAHIEQKPGDVVHSHYLLIAPATQGIGRNWLGSLSARIWSGNVALSVNLNSVLEGRFNAELSEKLLAVVDELKEGHAGSQWALAESLKSELTREHRRIKPKYGREHDEYNRIRWLMFSNHIMALPLTEDDRRFHVIENPTVPKAPAYYEQLYKALNDPAFVVSVRHLLRQRDISRFNPGARPVASVIKQQMTDSAKSDEDRTIEHLVETWKSDLIPQPDLQDKVFGGSVAFSGDAAKRGSLLKMMLSRVGGGSCQRPIKWNGKTTRIAILRNRQQWFSASAAAIRDELNRPGGQSETRWEGDK